MTPAAKGLCYLAGMWVFFIVIMLIMQRYAR